MPVQLQLLEDEERNIRRLTWSRLPELARREVVDLLAKLLMKCARHESPGIEELKE